MGTGRASLLYSLRGSFNDQPTHTAHMIGHNPPILAAVNLSFRPKERVDLNSGTFLFSQFPPAFNPLPRLPLVRCAILYWCDIHRCRAAPVFSAETFFGQPDTVNRYLADGGTS